MPLLMPLLLSTRHQQSLQQTQWNRTTLLNNHNVTPPILLPAPPRIPPLCTKHPPRMKDCHARCGKDNHRTFQDHERNLFIGEFASEALCQLRDSEA
jgi:hypothetical protein